MADQKITINDIQEDPENPRHISNEALDKLKDSMRLFDDIAGIVWNRRTKQLVAGHQRMKIIRSENSNIDLDEVRDEKGVLKTLKIKNTPYEIRVVDWPEKKQKAANIIANSPQIQGIFDVNKLIDVIEKNDLSSLPEYSPFDLHTLPDYVSQVEKVLAPKGDEADKLTNSEATEYTHLIEIKAKEHELLTKIYEHLKEYLQEHDLLQDVLVKIK